jgi:hypothetical protein
MAVVYWLVQADNCWRDRHDDLLEQLRRLKIPHGVHNLIPAFTTPSTFTLIPEAPESPILVMGSLQLGDMAVQRGWKPGIHKNANFDFEVQHLHWGAAMLNADAEVYRVSDIPPQQQPFFLRPVHDTKTFKGGVFDWPEFEEILKRMAAEKKSSQDSLSLDTPVVVAPLKKIWREWRLWFVDGVLVTYSLYRVGHRLYPWRGDGLAPDVRAFAVEQAGIWSPAKAFVMDVAETEQGCKIVEINTINHSGLYDCDLAALVEALNDLAVKEVRDAQNPL